VKKILIQPSGNSTTRDTNYHHGKRVSRECEKKNMLPNPPPLTLTTILFEEVSPLFVNGPSILREYHILFA
jgi:hypothetical protein